MRQVEAEVDRYLTLLGNKIRGRGFTQVEVQDALGWGRSYISQLVTKAKALRVEQVISHGPKENLVLRCRQWPGLQCIDALTEGTPLEGFWRDRSTLIGRGSAAAKPPLQQSLAAYEDSSPDGACLRRRTLASSLQRPVVRRACEGSEPRS